MNITEKARNGFLILKQEIMKSNLLYIQLLALLVSVVMTSCSSDSDDESIENHATFVKVDKAPDWQNEWLDAMVYTDSKPDWELVDMSDFDSHSVLVVKLDKELIPRSTDDDIMAVFVDGECRAISPRNVVSDEISFVLNVRGSSSGFGSEFSLCYYSGGLHQIFKVTEQGGILINEYILGTDKDFTLPLIYGGNKFSDITICIVQLPDNAPFKQTDDDLIAAFVGGECRGVCKMKDNRLRIFTHSPNEQVTLRYYSAESGGVYTDCTPIDYNNGIYAYKTFAF